MPWFLFLYLVAFPFGQLTSFEVSPGIRIHLVDLLAGLFVFAWLTDLVWNLVSGKKDKSSYPVFARPLLSFLGVAAFSLILGGLSIGPGKPVLVGLMYFLRLALYIMFYLGVAETVRREKNRGKFKQTLYDSLISIGFFIALGGILGYLLFPDTRPLGEYGWDYHYYRLIGSFLDPAFTGILIVLGMCALLYRPTKDISAKIISCFIFLVSWSALALTYSRASYVAAAVLFTTLLLLRRKIILFLVLAVLSAGTIYFLPHPGKSVGTNLARTQTITSRFDNYTKSLKVASKNPLFGIGYNLYKEFSDSTARHTGSGVHSSLLFTLTTTGVTGLLVYLGFIGKSFFVGWKKKKTHLGALLFSSLAALLAHSLFDNSLFYPWVMGWLGIVLALQED